VGPAEGYNLSRGTAAVTGEAERWRLTGGILEGVGTELASVRVVKIER